MQVRRKCEALTLPRQAPTVESPQHNVAGRFARLCLECYPESTSFLLTYLCLGRLKSLHLQSTKNNGLYLEIIAITLGTLAVQVDVQTWA